MAYTRTNWKARQGTNLNKFTKSQETDTTVVLTNAPDVVSEAGTPFSAENMNHIEEGIAGIDNSLTGQIPNRYIKIPNGTDMNSLTKPGFYGTDSVGAGTLVNMPDNFPLTGFSLMVLPATSINDYIQLIYARSGNGIWQRDFAGAQFGAWIKIAGNTFNFPDYAHPLFQIKKNTFAANEEYTYTAPVNGHFIIYTGANTIAGSWADVFIQNKWVGGAYVDVIQNVRYPMTKGNIIRIKASPKGINVSDSNLIFIPCLS